MLPAQFKRRLLRGLMKHEHIVSEVSQQIVESMLVAKIEIDGEE
jgi:hypothetical protein